VRLPPHTTFPLAEGLGIFVGIVAWDLLVDGHMAIIRSVLIAAACSLVWFGIRHWRGRARNQRRHGSDPT
jgi:arginine exporter protein ArgO